MTLARRVWGASGIVAPVLGFGASGPHGVALAGLGLAQTARLVGAVLDADAGLFDTAPFYGDAQARLGACLRGVGRDRFILVTKAGSRVTRAGLEKDFSPAGVTGSIETSLVSLGLDHVDLLLLHGPSAADCTDDLAAALQRLVERGLTRAVGACVRGPGSLAAAAWPPMSVLQGPVWEILEGQGWAHRAAARGQGFLAVEAMRASASGLRWPRRAADLWYLARAVAKREPGGDGVSPAARLAAALAMPGVSGVIATTVRLEHLHANLAVARAASV